METIIKPIAGGKTTEIIKRCAEQGGVIVCMDAREIGRIIEQSRRMGLDIALPITFDEFRREGYYAQENDCFHIDNAGMLIQSMTSVPVATITLTPQGKRPPETEAGRQAREREEARSAASAAEEKRRIETEHMLGKMMDKIKEIDEEG